jgi:hypothetical protein
VVIQSDQTAFLVRFRHVATYSKTPQPMKARALPSSENLGGCQEGVRQRSYRLGSGAASQ